MNVIDRPQSSVAALIDEPSWAEVIVAIEKADDLGPDQKCHWSTSLRRMGRYLDRPLCLIPTRIAAIGPAVKRLHPARLGVNPKTFANHRANARAALLWFNRQTPGCAQCLDGSWLPLAVGSGSGSVCAGHAVTVLSVPVRPRRST
jgi:hypothetical protein